MVDLLPCPFCGGPANESTERVGISTWLTFVKCWSCAFDMQMSKWNHRPIEDALRAEIAALKEVVRAADAMREELIPAAHPDDTECPSENCCDHCWSIIDYDAARAKVDVHD